MPERQRRAGRQIPFHGICYANAACFGSNEYLAAFRIGFWAIFYSDIMIVVINCDFHDSNILYLIKSRRADCSGGLLFCTNGIGLINRTPYVYPGV